MSSNSPDVSLKIQNFRQQEFDGPPQPLFGLETASHVFATVTFRLGALDIAAWVTRAVPFVDLSSWIQSLTTLSSDLHDPAGRHGFFDADTDAPVVFHRSAASVRVEAADGQELAQCSHVRLQSAIESGLSMIRTELEAHGEKGELYWSDAFDVLDPSWKTADDETFFASRHSWMFGPFFEARLECPDPGALERALVERTDCERRSPPKTICGPCWVAHDPSLEHSVGFLLGGSMSSIGFPPRQIERVCRLPESEAATLWPSGPCPTPQARSFLLWLVTLIQDLSRAAPVTSAVLAEEGHGSPTCGVEPGLLYVYSWAGIGEPTSDAE